jgi:hypothetical protein
MVMEDPIWHAKGEEAPKVVKQNIVPGDCEFTNLQLCIYKLTTIVNMYEFVNFENSNIATNKRSSGYFYMQLWKRHLYSPDLNPLDFNCSVQAPFELVVGYVVNF